MLLAFWGVDLILALDPGEVPRVAPVSVDGWALSFALILSIVTGMLFGVVPAWQASRPELQNTLKDNTRGSTGDGQRHFARAGLVLAEVSISLVLLVGAGLLFRSLMTLVDMPMGFTTSRMLTMSVAPTGESYRSPDQFLAYWDRVIDRVSAIPGVEKVALTGFVPMGGGMSVLSFQPDNKPVVPPNQQPISNFVDIGPNYFSTMGIPIVRGREFTKQDATIDPRVIVINEAMARREFPNEDPIGHRFSFGQDEKGNEQWVEIVGVVGNVRQYRADQEPVPITYAPNTGSPSRAQNLDDSDDGRSDEHRRIGARGLAVARPVAAGVAAAHARRRGRRVADAAPLQHDAADRVRDDRVDPCDRRHLRHGGVLGGAADAGDRHPRRAGRDEPRDSRLGALRIAQAGHRRPGHWHRRGVRADAIAVGPGLRRQHDRPGDVYFPAALLGVVAFLAGLFPALRASRIDPLEALRVD